MGGRGGTSGFKPNYTESKNGVRTYMSSDEGMKEFYNLSNNSVAFDKVATIMEAVKSLLLLNKKKCGTT